MDKGALTNIHRLRGKDNPIPVVPLSFEGEGQGIQPLTTPKKCPDFDSGASVFEARTPWPDS